MLIYYKVIIPCLNHANKSSLLYSSTIHFYMCFLHGPHFDQ